MNDSLLSICYSWANSHDAMTPYTDLLNWIKERNRTVAVEIQKTDLENCHPWYYDAEAGCISNENGSFFSICGFQKKEGSAQITQPIIMQPEIGYLGIICKEINGVMHFLMQAKIEPGNINKIQLSPTIQATKSNFTQKHGGKRPPYLEYFLNASKYEILVDQIQSEQSSRFYKKRNRNIVIRVEEEIEVLPSHRWMTLYQIKQLMREENLVNMDTRTVLSCLPFSKTVLPEDERIRLFSRFTDQALFRSIFDKNDGTAVADIYQYLNNYKMFSESEERLIPLFQLNDWEMNNGEFICRTPYPFKVIFCDIAIEGREVKHWKQPLFEAIGIATFGLLCVEENGVLKFLVKATPELGCFDRIELGPTLQREAVALFQEDDVISRFFLNCMETGIGVIYDNLLSEEGGRFYHEQNRNVVLRVDLADLPDIPEGYFLVEYSVLNEMIQYNNVLNIQLRNLLALLEV